jgi:hypothetical protein
MLLGDDKDLVLAPVTDRVSFSIWRKLAPSEVRLVLSDTDCLYQGMGQSSAMAQPMAPLGCVQLVVSVS